MAMKEVMKYALDLDTSGFSDGLADAKGEASKTFDGIGDDAQAGGSRFEGIGGSLGSMLVKGFAAVGVGALLLEATTAAFERQDALNVVTGQFRLTADEADRYGKLAGDLYAQGWGEGIAQVTEATALVAERIGATTDDELSKITESVLAVSKTWGIEFDDVVRSTSQLLQNNLAGSAQEALDLVVAAFQAGGDEAGDLLDTIDEYSQHWGALGLSGQDALNMVVDGLQNGQRDTDKLADATKEFRIRAVEDTDAVSDAYAELGLDSDELRRRILKGGDDARSAFLDVVGAIEDVEDPIDRNRLAVQFLGTQFEDLGPQALGSLQAVEGALGDVNDRAEELNDTVEATDWEQFRRRAEGWLGGLGNEIGGLVNDVAAGVEVITSGEVFTGDYWSQPVEGIEETARALEETMSPAADMVAESIREARDEVAEASSVLNERMSPAADLVATEIDRAAERVRRFGSDGVENMDEVAESAEDAADEVSDLEQAISDLRDEINNRQAYRELQDEFARTLESAQAATTAEKEGHEDAAAAADAHARQVDDLRLEVLDYLEGVGEIPPEKLTEIMAAIDRGSYNEAMLALNALTVARDVQIRITEIRRGTTTYVPPAPTSSGGYRAQGGPTFASMSHRVAEAAPEVFTDTDGRSWLIGEQGDVTPIAEAGAGGTRVLNVWVQGQLITEQFAFELVQMAERFRNGEL